MKHIAQLIILLLVACFAGCISKPTEVATRPQHQNITLVFFDKVNNAVHGSTHRLAPDVTTPDKATLLSQNFRGETEYNVTYQFLSRSGKTDVWKIILETPDKQEIVTTVKYDGNPIVLHESDEIEIKLK
jgi:hypothetical protein